MISLLIALLVSPAAVSGESAGQASETTAASIALLRFESDRVDRKVADAVAKSVTFEMRKLPGTKVLGPEEIEAMLGAERVGRMSGCSEMSCMAAIAGALGTDRIVKGSLNKSGDSYSIALRLFDVGGRGGRPEISFTRQIAGGSETDFIGTIPEAMATLFPDESSIWVKTPLEAGATAQVQKESPTKLPWIPISSGVALILGGGVASFLANKDYNDWKNVTEVDPRNKSLKDSAQMKQNVALSLFGVGAAALAGGLIWYFMTRPETPSAPEKKPGAGLLFSPMFVGTYGGAVSGTW